MKMIPYNLDYNPAPDKRIEQVIFRNVRCDYVPPVKSVIAGYDAEHDVQDVLLENMQVCGKALPMCIGDYTSGVTVEECV